MTIQDTYQTTLKFAALKHSLAGQTIPGSILPYTVHIANVAMEILCAYQYDQNFDLRFAVQLALLHDTLEDTNTSFDELADQFGTPVAEGVAALTKNNSVDKNLKMSESIQRIKKCQKEVSLVKLADRITNMQEPPQSWTNEKKIAYQLEAKLVLEELGSSNVFLKQRLIAKILEYDEYINPEQKGNGS